jgi:hypothetical protein
MSKDIYTIIIDLNDTKLYPVLRMLSFICTQSPYAPLFPITSVYQIYSCIHLLYYVTCCHFLEIADFRIQELFAPLFKEK